MDNNLYTSRFVRLGERNYVQGGTLVEGMLEAIQSWGLGNLDHLMIDCRGMLNEQGLYELFSGDVPEHKASHANTFFDICCDGVEYKVILTPNGEPVEESKAYDEESMVAGFSLDKSLGVIEFNWIPQLSPVKVLIALNKILLKATFPSEQHGAWIFYRANLNWSEFNGEGCLQLKKGVTLGKQTAQTRIFLDGVELGKIFFWRPSL